jgi:hypothetical protein
MTTILLLCLYRLDLDVLHLNRAAHGVSEAFLRDGQLFLEHARGVVLQNPGQSVQEYDLARRQKSDPVATDFPLMFLLSLVIA